MSWHEMVSKLPGVRWWKRLEFESPRNTDDWMLHHWDPEVRELARQRQEYEEKHREARKVETAINQLADAIYEKGGTVVEIKISGARWSDGAGTSIYDSDYGIIALTEAE